MKNIIDWLNTLNVDFCIEDDILYVKDLAIRYIDISLETDKEENKNKHNTLLADNLHPITIFSDEWEERKDQCQNYIKSMLRIHAVKYHGRKCIIKEVQRDTAKTFIDKHHIQGSNNLGIVFFGLYYNDELLGILSLGRHNRAVKDDIIVLDRLCFANGVQVSGGASKLFSYSIKWAIENHYSCIISFSDNRWSLGAVYKVLGFDLERQYNADYCYVDRKNPVARISKQSQKKQTVNCPEGLTEYQWATDRGLFRLWDCGKKRWSYKLAENYKTWTDKASFICAEQHRNGLFKHNHIRGYYKSEKNNSEIYYGSSFELRCIFLLEMDDNVKSYRRCDTFVNSNGKYRNPDLFVEYQDGLSGIIEVKPCYSLKDEAVVQQIQDSRNYCAKNNYLFRIWTEEDSLLGDEKAIVKWAKNHLKAHGNTEFADKQKYKNKIKANKYYQKKISSDKVDVYCDFCKVNHNPLRLTYEKNINRNNGKYVCERLGGHISGSKPKKKKNNTYADLGKKKCIGECNRVLPFECFSTGKSQCKECRAKLYKERYRKNVTD